MAEAATAVKGRPAPAADRASPRAPSPVSTRAPSPVSLRTAGASVAPPSVRLGSLPTKPAGASGPGLAGAGGGAPLAPQVAGPIATSLGVDLSGVRVHSDYAAASAAQAQQARAFAYGSHIFLGRGAQPTDLRLMAHEAAHVVQQSGAPRLQLWSPDGGDRFEREAHGASAAVVSRQQFTVTQRTPATPQRLNLSDVLSVADAAIAAAVDAALSYFKRFVDAIPGYRLFTIVLGFDPLTGQAVDRSAANILRALVEVLPGGTLISQALDKYGVFDRAGAWVDEQFRSLKLSGAAIKRSLIDFLKGFKLTDLADPAALWAKAKHILEDPAAQLLNFAKSVASGIVKLVKDAVLRPLAKLAEGTKGWDLLCVLLGSNPITGEQVPMNADALIGGFMKLIGHEEIYENMKKANALPRAMAWFQRAVSTLMGFVRQIPTLAANAFKALEISDILDLFGAIKKVLSVVGDFVGRFITWAGTAMWDLLQIIFEVVAPGALPYLKRTGSALKSIFQDPMPFMGHLVAAAKLGLNNFKDHFGEHLKAGLIEWLTGALPGVYLPKAFDLGEIVKFVMSVLGISWANVRTKLLKFIPEGVLKAMETGFDIVVALVRDGPAAAWDKIKEQLSNLKDTVISGIVDFIVNNVVTKAIAQLASMFIPGAGFIMAIKKIYDTVMVFVSKLSKIIQVVTTFIDSIVDIAAGNIGAAAKKVEDTLVHILSLAINFLAGFLGLGNVADKVLAVIAKVQGMVDKGLDKLVEWIVTAAKKVGTFILGKLRGDEGKKAAETALDPTDPKSVAIAELKSRLGAQRPANADALALLVHEVQTAMQPRGLKRLGVKVADEAAMSLQIEAEASPVAHAQIRWSEVFASEPLTDEEVEALRPLYERAGYETLATLSVDGHLVGSRQNAAGHAEQEVLGSIWQGALIRADALARQEKREVQVVLAINRSPCHSICTPELGREAHAARGSLDPRVKLILAATGAYLPSREMTAAERRSCAEDIQRAIGVSLHQAMKQVPLTAYIHARADEKISDPTRITDIPRLADAGWDVRALTMDAPPTRAQRDWIEAVTRYKHALATAVNAKVGH